MGHFALKGRIIYVNGVQALDVAKLLPFIKPVDWVAQFSLKGKSIFGRISHKAEGFLLLSETEDLATLKLFEGSGLNLHLEIYSPLTLELLSELKLIAMAEISGMLLLQVE